MSARRSKVRALLKRRDQLVRELIREYDGSHLWGIAYVHMKRGHHRFNVHAAREHARSLVRAYADNDHARHRCELGLRLLETLKGQPSECQGLKAGEYQEHSEHGIINSARARAVPCIGGWLDPDVIFAAGRRCPACRGTGHNLAGYLPEVVWSQAVQRRAVDWYDSPEHPREFESWCATVENSLLVGSWADRSTRTDPRGEHRDLDELMLGTLRDHTSHGYQSKKSRLPRWRRRELAEAARRREQAR